MKKNLYIKHFHNSQNNSKKEMGKFLKMFIFRGYTKIVRTGFRKGDGSPMCTIEYIDQDKI